MNPLLWRALVLPVIIVAAIFVVFGNFVQIAPDNFGLSARPGGVRIPVIAVRPGSQAAKAGIRAGDIITLPASRSDRLNLYYAPQGARVPLVVNGNRRVTLVAGRGTAVPFTDNLIIKLVRLAYLLVAALLAWRRPDDRVSRALVAFLFAVGFGVSLNNYAFGSPLTSFIVLQLFSISLLLYSMGAAARFAAIFPAGEAPPAARSMATIATILSTVGIAAVVAASLAGDSRTGLAVVNTVLTGSLLLSFLLVFAVLIERYAYSPLSERKRRLWIFLILGVGLLGPAVDLLVGATIGFNQLVDMYGSLTLMVIPIGLAYVILRHRVIDVGFVLNRAAVYGVVSVIVVGVFVIVETLLGRYVENTSHVTSTAVQLAVALVLGFSVRAIHARADRFVDTVLFRERHEAQAAIRTFAHDATYLTDESILTSRCVETVLRHAGATAAGIWVYDRDGRYKPLLATFPMAAQVDENDPAIVAMRARRVVAATGETAHSRLPGILAFPMIVRGELLGTLVCGAKSQDETYAPDERDALEALATAVGHAYDALEVRELRARLGLRAAGAATGGAAGMS